MTDRPHDAPTSKAAVPRPAELRRAYREELEPRKRSVFWSWVGFSVTFGAVRAITYSIREGDTRFHNVSIGGVHFHHYMWGIGMVSLVGASAVAGTERTHGKPFTGVLYGSGLALIVDEFALLLDLKDVYWAREGRLSVDLGVGMVALGGTVLSIRPILARLARDRGLIRRR